MKGHIRPIVLCLLAASALLLVHLPGARAAAFEIMTEELRPFNFVADGKVQGIATDLLLAIMERSGQPIERSSIGVVPWARGYKIAQDTPGAVLYSIARTSERETLFKWVGPIYPIRIGFIARKSDRIKIGSVADTEAYRVGCIRDSVAHQLLVKAGFPNEKLDAIMSVENNLKKLQAGRIDLFLFSFETAQYLMKTLGMAVEDYEVVHVVQEVDLYYAFHKSTDDAVVAKLQAALNVMRRPGAGSRSDLDKIVAKYLR